MITSFTSPIPTHILTDYDNRARRRRRNNGEEHESALEHYQLKGPVFREFTIHIFQSINFLQEELKNIDYKEIQQRMIELPHTKPGIKKTIIFDLDETLAHYVREKSPVREPDVFLNIKG
jgi:hypothetical protein